MERKKPIIKERGMILREKILLKILDLRSHISITKEYMTFDRMRDASSTLAADDKVRSIGVNIGEQEM